MILITALLLAVLLLLLGRPSPSENIKSQNALWNQLPKSGLPPSGLFPWPRALISSLFSLRRNAHHGYHKYSKKNLPFALPTLWTGKAVVVMPQSSLPLVNKPDSDLIGFWALVENIQLPYFIPDKDVIGNVIHFEVARKDLTRRNIARMAEPTAEEIEACFAALWGQDEEEWKEVNGWDMVGRVVARVALRTLLGLPVCRDEELIDATHQFANSLFGAAAVINCMPPSVRPWLAPLLAYPARKHRERYRKIVVPLIEERISLWKKHEEAGEGQHMNEEELPSDFIQWLIPRAAQHGPEHLDPSKLSYRLLALNTMFVYAIAFITSQVVIDLASSPERQKFTEGIARECRHVIAKHEADGGLASTKAVDEFYRLDSAIRESMRLSDVSVVMLPRDVVSKGPLDLSFGPENHKQNLRVPPGTRLMYPAQCIQRDPEFWGDQPDKFDAFRFSDPFDPDVPGSITPEKEEDRENLVDITTNFLAWGYGKKACPGRWYASQTIKQCLAYMFMNYEVEYTGGIAKGERGALLHQMIPPTGARLRFRRRKEEEKAI